ncbi:hypothetical protein [uncultured Paraglaciecola sp.]|uniref:hypothetical protein n=1 Tax=uncultured Paraglaciecola sp. TaxID=1765024 RepID=UPI0030DC9862
MQELQIQIFPTFSQPVQVLGAAIAALAKPSIAANKIAFFIFWYPSLNAPDLDAQLNYHPTKYKITKYS